MTTRKCNASLKKCPYSNGNVSRKGSPNILRRLIAYSEKVFRLSTGLMASLTDRRPEPRISTVTVAKAAMVWFLGPDGKPQRFGDVGCIPLLEPLAGPCHAQCGNHGRLRLQERCAYVTE